MDLTQLIFWFGIYANLQYLHIGACKTLYNFVQLECIPCATAKWKCIASELNQYIKIRIYKKHWHKSDTNINI